MKSTVPYWFQTFHLLGDHHQTPSLMLLLYLHTTSSVEPERCNQVVLDEDDGTHYEGEAGSRNVRFTINFFCAFGLAVRGHLCKGRWRLHRLQCMLAKGISLQLAH